MVFSLVGRVMAILSRLLEGPEIRIPYATILIACVAILAGECLAAFEPPFVDRVISDQDAIGKALMDEVRREIEAIPEATRESEGIAILEEALPRFPSEATRQRVLVSIGELSAKLGRTNDAIDAFRRGLNLAADPVLSSACRTRLAELLSAQGRTEEAAAVLAVVPEPDADRLGVSDLPSDRTDDVFEAERKRIELLIDQGKDEEGFERLVRFSNVYP
ncbi:MAG: tetratricopeptide repeat protein, partial [Brevundimonas sp.]